MPQPEGVPPSVTPTAWGVGQAGMADGSTKVIVQIQSATGVYVTFIEPADAQVIGAQLVQAGTQAKTGLILPPGAMN